MAEGSRAVIVLVCGGRNYDRIDLMHADMKLFMKEQGGQYDAIVHGGASGADYGASQFAKLNGIPEFICPANWNYFGRSAGILRNAFMLQFMKPDCVLAYPGGAGTADMRNRTLAAGLPLWIRDPH